MIIGHLGLMPGEERRDLLKRRTPSRLHIVVNVAAWQLNVFRARYVISDVLAHRGWDPWVVGVMDDEGGHADCRKQGSHIHFGQDRQHEGLLFLGWPPGVHAAPRSPGSPRSTACPDLRNVRTPPCPTCRPSQQCLPRRDRRCWTYPRSPQAPPVQLHGTDVLP